MARRQRVDALPRRRGDAGHLQQGIPAGGRGADEEGARHSHRTGDERRRKATLDEVRAQESSQSKAPLTYRRSAAVGGPPAEGSRNVDTAASPVATRTSSSSGSSLSAARTDAMDALVAGRFGSNKTHAS